MDLNEIVKNRIRELIADGNLYLRNGLSMKTTLNLLKKETMLSSKYFDQVISGLKQNS